MDRQLRLNRNGTTLDLSATPYAIEAGQWGSSGELLSFSVIVSATSLVELDRYVGDVRRWLAQAVAWNQMMAGDPVYVETKVCDEISTMAEVGAGWQRKLILSGSAEHEDPSTWTSGTYNISLNVTLAVSTTWERAAVAPVLVASSTSTVVRTDGGVTVPAAATLTARRVGWSAGDGFTVRARWLYSDNDCTFFNAEAGANDVKAYYLASDNKLYMQDSAGTTAASSALTTAAGTELDLVFKFDPVTPKMGIWVNGSANGTAATCVLEFTLGSELVLNGGFETGGTGTNFNGGTEVDDGTSDTFTSWTNADVNDGNGNKIEATATAQAGSYAAKMTHTTTNPYTMQSISVTPGYSYKSSLQSRGDGVEQGYFKWLTSTNVILVFKDVPEDASYSATVSYFRIPTNVTQISVLLYGAAAPGIVYYDAVSLKRNTEPDTYQIFAPSTAAQSLLSWQLWPAALTDAQCAALNAWGRPEPELAYLLAPADADNTDAFYKLHNVPGTDTTLLRAVLSNYSSGTDYAQVAYGFRPLRIQTTHLWECESGTLGAQTANNVEAAASGGNQARFTPASTSYGTQVTVVLCANPADVAAMQGRYRLYLACYDSAATVGVNIVQWRLVVAGVAEDWSSASRATAVSTRVLVDLGEVDIPPGAWPDESISAVTDVHAGSFITLEIQIKNTTGSGGGTFDFDALYLAPSELEGVVTCASLDNTDEYLVVDFTSDPVAAVTVRDYRSMEFASWATVEGDALELTPVAGAAGGFWCYAYRDTNDQAFPNDDITAWLYYRARWR
jgi:hypothetical protein